MGNWRRYGFQYYVNFGQCWSDGGGVVKHLACRVRGLGFELVYRHLDFRDRVSSFSSRNMVEILLKQRK